MAERVQVQGLGGQVPGISPTIQRGGQYAVQVQQAGRNKLMDLADALGQVNPMLQQYTQVADIEFEQFKEDLSTKSPEELQAMLNKTERELDKQSRRGTIPFLASPLNQKRKLRAIGKASHDLFMQRLIAADGRLNKPIEGDADRNTADIIQEELESFIAENPGLSSSQFSREGFQEAVNPTILSLTRQYDSEKARQSKAELGVSAVNELVRAAKDIDSTDFFDFQMSGSTSAMKSWDDLNGLQPAQQRSVIASTVKSLVRVDEMKAKKFLNWARTELKVGADFYGKNEAHVIEMEQLIEDIAEEEERADDKLRKEFVENESGALKVALAKFNRGIKEYVEPETGNKITFKDKADVESYFEQRVFSNELLTDGDKGKILDSFDDTILDTMRDAEMVAKERIRVKAPFANPRFVFSSLEKLAKAQVTDGNMNDQRMIKLIMDEASTIESIVQEQTSLLIAKDPSEAGNDLNEFATAQIEKMTSSFLDKVERLDAKINNAQIETKVDDTRKPTEKFGGLGPPDPDLEEVERPDSWYFTDSGRREDLMEKANVWYKTIRSQPADDEQVKLAKRLIQKNIPDLANEFAGMALDARKRADAGLTKAEAEEEFFQVARFLDDVFTLDVLENLDNNGFATTYAGIKFKPKDLIGKENQGVFVLLSAEQIENKSDHAVLAEVDRVLKAIGSTADRLEFIRAQEALRKINPARKKDWVDPALKRTQDLNKFLQGDRNDYIDLEQLLD
jgi:hypothetical protein